MDTSTIPLTRKQLHSDKWTTSEDRSAHTQVSYERALGASEAGFYPASQSGLGDMFLHIAFSAPVLNVMERDRIALAWAIIRKRHPLLASKVLRDASGSSNDPYFSFTPSNNAREAVEDAQRALIFNQKSKDELIFEYMNGARTLSDAFLSYLVISSKDLIFSQQRRDAVGVNIDSNESTITADFDLLMCAPHFLGDGTSLHLATHDLLVLLASPLTNNDMEEELNKDSNWIDILPPAFESRLNVPTAGFSKAVAKVDFARVLQNEIGGHSLPRSAHGPQSTILQEVEFTPEETALILQKCKSRGVTVNHVIVALCNLVWSKNYVREKGRELPLMMYTAINLRPHLSPFPSSPSISSSTHSETYWFIALTYFNLVLPSFLPFSHSVFWHRAQNIKSQIRKFVESPFLKSRALEMANIRVKRSKGEVVHVPTLSSLSGALAPGDTSHPNHTTSGTVVSPLPAAPSTALLGLSLIGNLDAIYTRSSYPTISLRSVTTASRQKASGLLLLEHTFGKKLCLHLCWDKTGFEDGKIERFWSGLEEAVREFLM